MPKQLLELPLGTDQHDLKERANERDSLFSFLTNWKNQLKKIQ